MRLPLRPNPSGKRTPRVVNASPPQTTPEDDDVDQHSMPLLDHLIELAFERDAVRRRLELTYRRG